MCTGSVAVALDLLSGPIAVPVGSIVEQTVGPRDLLMPLLAYGCGDAIHRGGRLKSAWPGETASFRLPDRSVCLCPGGREYGLRDSSSHTHELTGVDVPRPTGLHGPAIHAGNFPPSVPQFHFAKTTRCSCAWASPPWPLGRDDVGVKF